MKARTLPYVGVLIAAALLQASTAFAVDVTINFTSNIVAQPCTIAADTKIKKVSLGNIGLSKMRLADELSEPVPFTLELTHCPKTTNKVNMSIGGTPYANTNERAFDNAGEASNVAVVIEETADGTAWYPGEKRVIYVDKTRNTAQVNLRAYMVTPEGGATAGTVSVDVPVTLTYE